MSTMPVNLGRIDNHGWELLVNYRNNIGYFNYAIGPTSRRTATGSSTWV